MEVTNSCLTPCSLGFTPQMLRYAEKEIKSHNEYAFAVETCSKNDKKFKKKKKITMMMKIKHACTHSRIMS